ncbi:MAG TPA: undecaprenyl-phosphate glucose phosphotransferase, partial [Planctomycetia bacterium]|nr:undecaprenyl-phosphate glucose phosphotransferase [Planctomycetia bacterium]
IRAAKASALLVLLWLAALFYTRDPYESRLASLLFAGLTTVALMASRRGFAVYFRWRRRGGFGKRTLIVGTGRAARRVARALRKNAWLGMQPMGFVAADAEGAASKVTPPVGAIEDLPRLVDEYGIDYVFIALPLEKFGEARRVFDSLRNTLVDIRVVPDLPSFANVKVEMHAVEGLPVLSLQPTPHGLMGSSAKRAMDFFAAGLGLIFLSPFLALLGLLVRLSSPGPILYSQERMGLNGRRFRMYKFRTMRVDAEKCSGPVWAKAGDDRRTRIGAFLRSSSLDELPQLWNVLVGDMSLVGPRPERPYFIDKFRGSIPRYMHRHAMRAGMTGWAQVHGWRGNTSLRKRVQYDLYYISHWSLWLDVRILYLTFAKALWDKNAY